MRSETEGPSGDIDSDGPPAPLQTADGYSEETDTEEADTEEDLAALKKLRHLACLKYLE